MFTGIVEVVGKVVKFDQLKTGNDINSAPVPVAQIVSMEFQCGSDFLSDVRIGDSICVQGACLTVTTLKEDSFTVDLSPETLMRTNLKAVNMGDSVNLEKAMRADGRFGGHLVQGHVDCTATVEKSDFVPGDNGKSTQWLTINVESQSHMALIVEKGFICINGISLTICSVDIGKSTFTVMLIPHTQKHTSAMDKGTLVNLEFDMMGKYIIHQKQFLAYNKQMI